MKTKKKVLIGLMALCLAGGIGSAFALQVTRATGSITGSLDSAVYFAWDQNEIPDIDQLKGGVAQYSSFSATVTSTKSVAGTVTISFGLVPDTELEGKTAVLTGLTVTVYETSAVITSNNGAALAAAGTSKCVLDASHLTGSATFAVSTSANVHDTQKAYVLKFEYNSASALGANQVLSGYVSLASSFSV